jgi:hypothetical protein
MKTRESSSGALSKCVLKELSSGSSSSKSTFSKRCKKGSNWKEWAISEHPSQSISAVGQVTWTEGTEMAINDLAADPYAVEDYLTMLKQQLSELTELIRSDLDQI